MQHAPLAPSPRSDSLRPALLAVWREGYGLRALRADAVAGLTVAIVALPLSMAIAIASGVSPDRGLYTAIVGGFLVSALGGCRLQIGGPAGAFIVMVGACVAAIGVQGLVLATALSGLFLVAAGLLRLGRLVARIPHEVVVGFTAGIAVIILASQIKDILGVTLPPAASGAAGGATGGAANAEGGAGGIAALWGARASVNPAAVALAAGTMALILGLRRLAPRMPALLVAVVAGSVVAAALALPVDTIGSRFGALPRLLPRPALPDLSGPALRAALPYAAAFALLGAIESLLSAVVADRMSGHRHHPSGELVAQGLANIGSALFGGFCVTGTIARTATNVRAGAHGPVAGMLHALFLVLFMAAAAPLAAHIPVAVLAGLLAVVAWNMVERAEMAALLRARGGGAAVLLVTLVLVVATGLVEGIVAGTLLAALLRRRARPRE